MFVCFWSVRCWLINLWLTNDEGGQNWLLEMAQEAVRESELDRDDAISIMASALETYIEDSMPEMPGMYQDLMTSALAYVDWHEIAAHHIDDVWDEVATELAE